jgi:hypothetical protein
LCQTVDKDNWGMLLSSSKKFLAYLLAKNCVEGSFMQIKGDSAAGASELFACCGYRRWGSPPLALLAVCRQVGYAGLACLDFVEQDECVSTLTCDSAIKQLCEMSPSPLTSVQVVRCQVADIPGTLWRVELKGTDEIGISLYSKEAAAAVTVAVAANTQGLAKKGYLDSMDIDMGLKELPGESLRRPARETRPQSRPRPAEAQDGGSQADPPDGGDDADNAHEHASESDASDSTSDASAQRQLVVEQLLLEGTEVHRAPELAVAAAVAEADSSAASSSGGPAAALVGPDSEVAVPEAEAAAPVLPMPAGGSPHVSWYVARTNRPSTCVGCKQKILPHTMKAVWVPDPNTVNDKRVWSKLFWKYYHI